MKTSQDPRHKNRVNAVKELFAWNFSDNNQVNNPIVKQIIENLPEVDQQIRLYAPEWPIEQINKVDLAILRLAVFELIINKEIPYKVVVDEAVEIAKEFGSQSSPAFINGVLGKLINTKKVE